MSIHKIGLILLEVNSSSLKEVSLMLVVARVARYTITNLRLVRKGDANGLVAR